ncbi:kinase-like domain-containing protein [Rhizophagus clarus]|uniref:Kinase-like domain-containing protein n=1 Tax=Rhizophagus clarus TaxID=94130 RepID=A0A8H3KW67_9GLOM|nr:kinase-like domain-containing protein [Rhizophagus clarus]
MTSSNEWFDTKIQDGNIHFFQYSEFGDMKKTGGGGFGIVKSAYWKNCGNKIALKSFINNSLVDANNMNEIIEEIKLDETSLATLLHSLYSKNLKEVGLHSNINRFLGITKEIHFNNFQWNDKIRMALDECLHSKHIIYKDLHAKNMMIAGFGTSKQLSEGTSISANSKANGIGMIEYMEPQCFKDIKYKKTKKSDIYSLDVYEKNNNLNIGNDDLEISDNTNSKRISHCRECGNEYTDKLYNWSKWYNGPLYYDQHKPGYTRYQFDTKGKKVTLKCLRNLQIATDEFLDKVKSYSTSRRQELIRKIYGISQNPDTKDYIIVLEEDDKNDYCEKCDKKNRDHRWYKPCQTKNFTNWTSGNEKIDQFIKEMQNISNDTIFKWIPYNQFNGIKKISRYDYITIYSATWKSHLLYYNNEKTNVILKCLHNPQIDTNELLNKVKAYLTNDICKIYGISQNPGTKDYIIVLEGGYCKECDKKNTYINRESCKPYLISHLKRNFANWSSGNEKINQFIREMQLKINSHNDIIFEWISYRQFNNIEKINRNSNITVEWKSYSLCYDINENKYIRKPREALNVTLKSYSDIDYFLNKIKAYSISRQDDIRKIYGITQNPFTKDYIMVLEGSKDNYCEECDKKCTDINHNWCESCQKKFS